MQQKQISCAFNRHENAKHKHKFSQHFYDFINIYTESKSGDYEKREDQGKTCEIMARLKPRAAARLIKKISDLYSKSQDDIEIPALKTLEGQYKQRIFNKGATSSGGKIGSYKSTGHIKKRKKAGRQVGYKDLEFEGDLRRNIQVGKSQRKNVLGFVNTKSRLIADGQESQTNKVIFEPSQEESKKVVKDIAALLAKKAKNI